MKKIFFLLLVAFLVSCEKDTPGYYEPAPEPAPTVTGDNYFIPAFTREEDAPIVRFNEPIFLNYYSKTAGWVTFTLTEGTSTLATVNLYVTGEPVNGYYTVPFPDAFLIPPQWAGKLIMIKAGTSATPFTLLRVRTEG